MGPGTRGMGTSLRAAGPCKPAAALQRAAAVFEPWISDAGGSRGPGADGSASGCNGRRRCTQIDRGPKKQGRSRRRVVPCGVQLGRKPNLTPYQMKEAINRRDRGGPRREIARS